MKAPLAFLAAFAMVNWSVAGAADMPHAAGAEGKSETVKPESASPMAVKPMSGKGPMATEMKRPGMMKSDVKKAFEKKEAMMDKAMKKETEHEKK